jgi:hypothetical protein
VYALIPGGRCRLASYQQFRIASYTDLEHEKPMMWLFQRSELPTEDGQPPGHTATLSRPSR